MTKKFSCPMHPQITAERPGNCPLCQMPLSAAKGDPAKSHVRDYMPLITVILMILVSSLIASWGQPLKHFLISFMTGFFLVFSGFKLMDLPGFARGYSTYDLLASRWLCYGYIYPFIELIFGLVMLGGYHEDWLLACEFIVMVFSGVGVTLKLLKREPFMCACLGTFLKVPLTFVTLIEDFGMALLALIAMLLK